MSDRPYTQKEIKEFIPAANRDLGSGKYKACNVIPDYCKAVEICKQFQTQLIELDVVFEPVRDWYDGDGKRTNTIEMLKDAITDLRADRTSVLQLQAELAEKTATIKKKIEYEMPDIMQGQFHNACTDSCDMIDGPCACGAWHNAKEWLERLVEYIKQYKLKLTEKDIEIKEIMQPQLKKHKKGFWGRTCGRLTIKNRKLQVKINQAIVLLKKWYSHSRSPMMSIQDTEKYVNEVLEILKKRE